MPLGVGQRSRAPVVETLGLIGVGDFAGDALVTSVREKFGVDGLGRLGIGLPRIPELGDMRRAVHLTRQNLDARNPHRAEWVMPACLTWKRLHLLQQLLVLVVTCAPVLLELVRRARVLVERLRISHVRQLGRLSPGQVVDLRRVEHLGPAGIAEVLELVAPLSRAQCLPGLVELAKARERDG